MFDYDAELRLHNEHLRAATHINPHDRVLDIGCGTGQTTRQAARAATHGSALGIDLSAPMLEQARKLTHDQGLTNTTYQRADAQTHPFPPAHFDLCISRFGTMFFTDPTAAFTNIGHALRPAARLVMLVWQSHDRNEWATALHQNGPGPFSLADPTTTEGILTSAGFTHVTFTDVHEPVYYGPDPDTAFDNALHLQSFATNHTHLRATLEAHHTDTGVSFDSRAWLITARRAPYGDGSSRHSPT
ncbi:class I SAM-dependent methyltransferase [Nonomuraea sp. NPDC050556]|uniref:class I SAM-dependent methyltransferase n=1 Tax=Nonomuraea sp. NPDC050556 TaxID=3364369 RepID=UPI0037A2CA37